MRIGRLLGLGLLLFGGALLSSHAGLAHRPPTIENALVRSVPVAKRLMADLQLSENQAAGILGHLIAESKLDPRAVGPHGRWARGALGIAQWIGPRRVAFENFTKERGLNVGSMEANILFLEYELLTSQNQYLVAVKATYDPVASAHAFIGFEDRDPTFRRLHLADRSFYAKAVVERLDHAGLKE